MKQLTGPERAELRNILLTLYDPNSFAMMLGDRLNKIFFAIVSQNNFTQQLHEVIQNANMEGWIHLLVHAVVKERPQAEDLLKFAEKQGLTGQASMVSPAGQVESGLEKIVTESEYYNIGELLKYIAGWEAQVCRIEYKSPSKALGTGFLIGKDLVMSNYHVFEDLINGTQTSENFICRFDYKTLNDGIEVYAGTCYDLVEEAVIDASPYCNQDLTETGLSEDWPADRLDYALVRLAQPAGEEPPGPSSGGSEQTRGWVKLEMLPDELNTGDDLFIVQHPEGAPVKLAWGSDAVIGYNNNKQRMRYRINTEPGSSGSPCFDRHFRCVALHHVGDPRWHPEYNQGIPIHAILTRLVGQGHGPLLGM